MSILRSCPPTFTSLEDNQLANLIIPFSSYSQMEKLKRIRQLCLNMSKLLSPSTSPFMSFWDLHKHPPPSFSHTLTSR